MDCQEKGPSTTIVQETPPPPYSQCIDEEVVDVTEKVSFAQSTRPQTDSQPSSPVSITSFSQASPFPASWTLYFTLSISRTLTVGSHEVGPLFAVSRHPGWWTGKPDLVLHCGPHSAFRPFAAGIGGVGIGRHSVIVLPPLPGSGQDFSQELLMRVDGENAAHVRFRFAIEVGTGSGEWRREIFEWQHCHQGVVGMFLDGAKSGWKLVHLPTPEDDIAEESQSNSRQEIVAVWAYAKVSMTKVLRFRYLGSGATGILGQRWNVMAAMTALRMYQRQQKNRNKDW
ncbi:hypothetical protein F5Y05DRAFT_392479 [Hypoxylon sp. FL0543]|nr:hypothetical protein F5Y05DRAFT_392479 [Hypoxylon sp. FL0543]